LLIVAGLPLAGCSQKPAAETQTSVPQSSSNSITLFVPCGMLDPFMKIRRNFESLPDKPVVKIENDNAVVLMRKIRRGDYADIFVTPGETEMNLMVKEGFIDPASIRPFGTFRMILVVPAANKADVKTIADLSTPKVKSVAIAEPGENSVGFYAVEALKSLKLWDAVQPKIISHWHALEAVTYVCKERVDVGVYFNSCPFETTPSELKGYHTSYKILETIPETAHPRVKVQAATLKKSSNAALANRFLDYLLQPEAQELLKASGIPNLPKESNGKP
jgi:molybdate transport system substrate-binding protein